MNTAQLQCFTTLANTLNYIRAAEELNLTQPAVSRQIQSLEQELGAKLFHRTTRSVSLTLIGEQFLPEAKSMLKTYYHSLEWIAGFHTNAHYSLRIGYADTLVMQAISAMLKPLLQKAENLSPQFTLDQTDANLRRLTNGDLDLVFGIKDAKFMQNAITFTPLHQERFICVCAKDHPLALQCQEEQTDSVHSEDLLNYRQIFDIPPYLLKHAFSRGHHLLPVNDALDNIMCANASEAYALVELGIGYTLLPNHLLKPNEKLAFLPWQESPQTWLGIYCEKSALKDKTSAIYQFVQNASAYYQKETSK